MADGDLSSGGASAEPLADIVSFAGFAGAAELDGVFFPAHCEFRSQYRCDSYDPLAGCECDESLPESPEDCGGAARMHCARTLCALDEVCSFPASLIDCQCLDDAPAKPEDCDGPGQFFCAHYAPEFRDCRCETTHPATPGECAKPEDYFCENAGDGGVGCSCMDHGQPEDCDPQYCSYQCQSDEPRFGCRCECITIR